jgi:hypothetical protein
VLSGDLETTESLANFQIHKHNNNNNNGVFIMTQIIIITRYATALLPILKNPVFSTALQQQQQKKTQTGERERERERERAKWT